MKNIILFSAILCTLVSCRISRQATETTVKTSDSSVTSNTSSVNDRCERSMETTTKDTIIGIPAREVSETLDSDAFVPAMLPNGVAVERRYTKAQNGVQAYVARLPSGAFEYGCKTDSLTLVINNLKEIVMKQARDYDSLATEATYYKYHNEVTQRQVIEFIQNFFSSTWYIWVIIIVIGFIIFLLKILH